jgi:hypothetical protein
MPRKAAIAPRDQTMPTAGVGYKGSYTTSEFDEVVMPFLKNVDSGLRKLGFVDAQEWLLNYGSSDVPLALTRRVPASRTGSAISEFLIGIGIFLGSSIGGWAVKKFCDEVYDVSIGPSVRQLMTKLAKRNQNEQESRILRFQLGVWFATDRVHVQLVLETDGKEDTEVLMTLIPEAFRRAQRWVEQHGVTHPFMTYHLMHGQLSSAPQLSEELTIKR